MRLTGSLWTIVTQGTSGSGTAKTSSADSVFSISRGAGAVTPPMLPPRGVTRINGPPGGGSGTGEPPPTREIVKLTKWGYDPCHEHSGPWAAGGCPLYG